MCMYILMMWGCMSRLGCGREETAVRSRFSPEFWPLDSACHSKHCLFPQRFLLGLGLLWFESKSHSVVQIGLEFTILLPLPHEFWDYKHMPQSVSYFYIFKFSRFT